MSASLLRRGLELLAEEVKDNRGVDKKKDQMPSVRAPRSPAGTGGHGVARPSKHLENRAGPARSRATVKGKATKCVLEEFRKKRRKSHMSFNLQYFSDTSCKATEADSRKIISHNLGRQSRNKANAPIKKAKKPESLFTEEEFQQFQKEYFGSVADKE